MTIVKGDATMKTVRNVTYELLRRNGINKVFGNPAPTNCPS